MPSASQPSDITAAGSAGATGILTPPPLPHASSGHNDEEEESLVDYTHDDVEDEAAEVERVAAAASSEATAVDPSADGKFNDDINDADGEPRSCPNLSPSSTVAATQDSNTKVVVSAEREEEGPMSSPTMTGVGRTAVVNSDPFLAEERKNLNRRSHASLANAPPLPTEEEEKKNCGIGDGRKSEGDIKANISSKSMKVSEDQKCQLSHPLFDPPPEKSSRQKRSDDNAMARKRRVPSPAEETNRADKIEETITPPSRGCNERVTAYDASASSHGLGVYVPPFKLRRMEERAAEAMTKNKAKASELSDATNKMTTLQQRRSWESLKKAIHGSINRINTSNVRQTILTLFQNANLQAS
mmetsp:Transcript_24260/g.55249  ORF Transcript_24260/g.55249 Transcript_24260/m.55249 type:complete len:357 (-) Transcript_24260:1415-2485(-)